MKKHGMIWLPGILILWLLLSGFTRIEKKAPSVFHGSTDMAFGTFCVPVPDYYVEGENGYYEYAETGAEATAVLAIRVMEVGSALTKKDFDGCKESTLDSLVVKKERTSCKELTVAGGPAVMAEYIGNGGERISAVLILEEGENRLLFLGCLVDTSASYGGYLDDFAQMLKRVTISNHVSSSSAKAGTGGVTMEVKEFWDSYEAFVDEYVAFMQDYMENPYDFSLLTRLNNYMQKLADLEEKAEKYEDSSRYSEADLDYSLEVYGRIMQKLAGVL